MARRAGLQRRKFAKRVDGLLRQTNSAERQSLRGAWAIIHQAQRSLIDLLSSSSGWALDNLNELRSAVEATTESIERRMTDFLNGEAENFWQSGIDTTIDPIAENLNIHIGKGNIDTRMLQVLQVNTADLVSKAVQKTRQGIHNEVNMAVMGMQRPHEALASIRKILAADPKRRGTGLTYEAERIVRTEMNRAHSIASFEAMKQVQEVVPTATKEWVTATDGRQRHSHDKLNGMKVPVNEPFTHSSIKTPGGLMYPRDPRGLPSDVINCRCRVVISRDIVEKEFDNGLN